MPDLQWNKDSWDHAYDWARLGEEWSESWGGSEAQWFGTLYPRLHRFLPAGNLLEIAPGYGRWTHYLLRYIQGSYLGIDLSEACITSCKERFSGLDNTSFAVNDGLSLGAAEDGDFDMVFSFDSLVHANLDVHQTYIPQIIRKLRPNGIAFIHHSNWADCGSTEPNNHCRAEDVGASDYAMIVKEAGGEVLLQECVNWGSKEMIDAFTVFQPASKESPTPEAIMIANDDFMLEANIIRTMQSAYSRIPRARS